MQPSSFEDIVRTHGAGLSRLAWGYTDNAADHDDLVQDILVAVWTALPRFRGDASERTFVFRIGHNRGHTFVTRRRPRHDEVSESLPDPRPAPDEVYEQDRERERLRAAIRRLPAAHREAVLMRLEGFSMAEIASVQGTTENNVAVRLTRARDQLRELMGERS